MEPLIVTTDEGVWREVEVLQWMERNTQLFADEDLSWTVPLKTTYKSDRRIAELVGGVIVR